jgi:hypothetical protein
MHFAESETDSDITVIQNNTFFSDAMPKLSNKTHPLHKTTINCAMYKKTHTPENSEAAYRLLSFWCITIWYAYAYTMDTAHSYKLLVRT